MSLNSQAADISAASEKEHFFHRIAGILDAGAVGIMLSLGHRLGLFDTLAKLPPSTSQQVADAASLSERYVREWLAVMVVAKIVVFDPAANTYSLPESHAACLTRRAPLGNLAVYAQSIAMAGAVEDRIRTCFESGDGLPYEDYPCFHQIMAEDSAQTVAENLDLLLDALIPDAIARLEQGIDVLDAGCGAGRTLSALAKRFPSGRFTGYDLCPDAIAMARDHVAAQAASNARFEVVDLTNWQAPEMFDLITSFDAVHDTRNPRRLIASIHQALRPQGIYLMQDIGGSAQLENNIDFPFAAFLYAMSTVHCTPVSLAQGGDGLGTMWGWETAQKMLEDAGFEKIKRTVLPHDPMNVWFVSRKPG